MQKFITLFTCILCPFLSVSAQEMASVQPSPPIVKTSTPEEIAASPRQVIAEVLKTAVDANIIADFRPNKGQWRTLAMFRMNTEGKNAQFFTNGVEFGETIISVADSAAKQRGYLWGFTFIRSDKWVKMSAKYPKGGTNHVIGKDRIAFISSNTELWYEDVYRSIDFRFFGCNQTQFLYDIIAQPFAELKDIQLQLTGVQEWSVDAAGELDIKFDAHYKRHIKPSAFQYLNGEKVNVPVQFVKTEEGHLGFKVDESYKSDKTLVISQL
jgi:hypothetical protein